jgi:hypothetical protein
MDHFGFGFGAGFGFGLIRGSGSAGPVIGTAQVSQ